MDEKQLKQQLINPYYAINFDPDFTTKHAPIVSESQWVSANVRLIDELGSEEWLQRLLAALQGDYPRNPDEAAQGGGQSSRANRP
jgi:hypothetical protein